MKIKIAPTLFIMAAVMTALGYGYELAVYLITIILHELAHAHTAQRLGYALNVIKLAPYGASLSGSFEGVARGDEIKIALAGPMMNILLALVVTAMWWLTPSTYAITQQFATANIATALFNLLPIYPLDGGRSLLAWLSKWKSRNVIHKYMRIAGGIVGLAFLVLFCFSFKFGINPTFFSVGAFVFGSTVIPDKTSSYGRLYTMAYRTERLKNGMPVREIMVRKDATFIELSRMINPSYYHRFIITDEGFTPLATITEHDLEQLSLMSGHADISVYTALKQKSNK